MNLSSREKLLLAVLAGVLVVGALFLVTQSVIGYKETLRRSIVTEERILRQAQRFAGRLDRLKRKPRRSATRISLIGHVEKLAGGLALRDRLQLNPLSQIGNANLQGVQVRLDKLTLDDMLGFVHAVENSDPVLVIDQMEITPNFRTKELLRLTARVLAEK